MQKFVDILKTHKTVNPDLIPGSNDTKFPEDFTFEHFTKEDQPFHMETFSKFHFFHLKTARYFFEQAGFKIEEIGYSSLNFHEHKLDGREYVTVIAKKSKIE